MLFFVSLLVEGLLAGAVYALFALAFVVVYKASGMINFALGEWAMLGTGLVATPGDPFTDSGSEPCVDAPASPPPPPPA